MNNRFLEFFYNIKNWLRNFFDPTRCNKIFEIHYFIRLITAVILFFSFFNIFNTYVQLSGTSSGQTYSLYWIGIGRNATATLSTSTNSFGDLINNFYISHVDAVCQASTSQLPSCQLVLIILPIIMSFIFGVGNYVLRFFIKDFKIINFLDYICGGMILISGLLMLFAPIEAKNIINSFMITNDTPSFIFTKCTIYIGTTSKTSVSTALWYLIFGGLTIGLNFIESKILFNPYK